MSQPTPSTLPQRIRLIVRRDLKVGEDVNLDDDTPLFGSHTDLDSLDALLLVTGIEKEFKIKIPKESMGRHVFTSIRTLALFVEQFLSSGAAAAAVAAVSMGQDPLSLLPHGPAFRFLTRLVRLSPGDAGEAIWSLKGDEPFFAAHFPGHPVVPGVLIAESMAQLSGIVGAAATDAQGGAAAAPAGRMARIAHLDIRYRASVSPPAEVVIQSRLVRTLGAVAHFEVRASLGQQVVAEGSLAMGFA